MYLVIGTYFVWLMFYEYISNKKNTLLLAFSCSLIAVLASIRYQIGTDYNSYFSMFHSLLQDPNSVPRIEVGWRYITHSLSFLGFNEYGCFAFWAIATMSLVFYGLKKHAAYPLIGCSVFFFVYTAGWLFSGMRQAMVCAIVIASLDIIKERKHVRAACLFLIALSIHKVAIILLPLYIAVMFDSIIGKHKYWILLAALCIGIGGYCVQLALLSTEYIPSETVAHSIDYNINNSELAEKKWNPVGIAKRVILVLIVLYLSTSIEKKWKYCNVAVPLYFWGNIIALSMLSALTVASRACLLVKMLDLLILPSFLLASDNQHWRRGIMAVVVFWCAYAFYNTVFLRDHLETVYPFKTIFD